MPRTPQVAPPLVLDAPTDEVENQLHGLRLGRDEAIPAKRLDDNLLIASWNIRAFGGLTENWQTEEGDSPKRNLGDVRAIAEIIRRFDVIAVQETRVDRKGDPNYEAFTSRDLRPPSELDDLPRTTSDLAGKVRPSTYLAQARLPF